MAENQGSTSAVNTAANDAAAPPAPAAAAASAVVPSSVTVTTTVTETENLQEVPEVLTLTLQGRPSVTWDENVVDNEGMGRKSSKRCCIFHKQRAFGESSTDSSDYDSDRSSSSSASNASGGREGSNAAAKKRHHRKGKIARPKNGQSGKMHDYQRYHA